MPTDVSYGTPLVERVLERGEPSVLVVVGFLLFVFPEPATSVLGAGLMLFGCAWWFYEWNR